MLRKRTDDELLDTQEVADSSSVRPTTTPLERATLFSGFPQAMGAMS